MMVQVFRVGGQRALDVSNEVKEYVAAARERLHQLRIRLAKTIDGIPEIMTMQERAEISIERWLGDNYINARVSSKVEEPALADD